MKFDLENFDENKAMRNLGIGVLIILICYTLAVSFIFKDWKVSGPFGDTFGALTSLFSGLAFILLILTLIIQKKEYRITRKEFELSRKAQEQSQKALTKQAEILYVQSFENTFFNLMEAYPQTFQKLYIEIDDINGLRKHYLLGHILFKKRFYKRVKKSNTKQIETITDNDLEKFYSGFCKSNNEYLKQYYNYISLILETILGIKESQQNYYFRIFLSYLKDEEIINLQYYYLLDSKDTFLYHLLRQLKIIEYVYSNNPRIDI